MARLITSITQHRWLLPAAVAIGFWLGGSHDSTDVVHAEIRKTPPRQAFLSGSERSEQVLREISQTLKIIDGRLARLEKLAAARTP